MNFLGQGEGQIEGENTPPHHFGFLHLSHFWGGGGGKRIS